MAEILAISPEKPEPQLIERAVQLLRRGEVVGIPTDTLYGLAADPFNLAAVARLYQIKGRPERRALPILIASIDQAEELVGNLPDIFFHLAERFWPGESPLGKLVNTGRREGQVVGLLRYGMYRNLTDEDQPAFFLPIEQNPSTTLTLLARTSPDGAADLLPMLRAEVANIDARLPIMTLQTMEDVIASILVPQRIGSWLLSLAGGLGLLLATVGLYGVMSFLVFQRTHEVGVRMALGAEARHVVRMIVGRGLALSAVGVVVGLGLAALVTRFLQGLLFGVSPLDVSVFALMAVAALAVAGLASWVPARRASGVDPLEALRHE